MTNYFIVPGLGNSSPEHWQSYFEASANNFKRIIQREWDAPSCEDWVSTIETNMKDYDWKTVALIGHSPGCAAIVHWAAKYKHIIKGALLVAPSDVEATNYNFPTVGFSPLPLDKINFKTIVVASTNDEWLSLARASYFADKWGSELINIGNAGHINVASGHTKWNEGLRILERLN